MSTWSRLIRPSRLIQPPEEQNAPVLSVSNESATSGGLPLRMPATILLLSIEPTLLTLIFGWSLWKPCSAWFQIPSSRSVKPLQTVSVVALLSSNFAAALLLPPPPPPPPQPAATAATTPTTTTNTIRCIPITSLRVLLVKKPSEIGR